MAKIEIYTVSRLCRELGIYYGSEKDPRPDVKYFLSCCNVPEHRIKLVELGFDPDNPTKKARLPYPASQYILKYVFEK